MEKTKGTFSQIQTYIQENPDVDWRSREGNKMLQSRFPGVKKSNLASYKSLILKKISKNNERAEKRQEPRQPIDSGSVIETKNSRNMTRVSFDVDKDKMHRFKIITAIKKTTIADQLRSFIDRVLEENTQLITNMFKQ